MSEATLATPPATPAETQPALPLRRLHNYVYCPRLFYYQWVENIFQENGDTVAGSHLHRNADRPTKLGEDPAKLLDLPEGAKVRSLRLESPALGIVGVVDILEGGGEEGACVIDYKKGSARRDESGQRVAKEADAIQVAAQALLLREQGVAVKRGAVYYAEDKRRVPVELTEALFQKIRALILEAKELAASGHCPPPLPAGDARCAYCSAYPVCLPHESARWAGTEPLATQAAPVPVAPRPENDDGEILVVHTPGSKVGHRGGHMVVTTRESDTPVQKLPIEQVRAVYLYGAVQLSAQAAETCLEQGIDVSYFSPAGRFLGLLRGLPASGVDARLGQYRLFTDPVARLGLAREAIRGKIHNQRVLLMRNGSPPERVLDQMAALRDSALKAPDLNSLLGTEGTAAALYFEHLPTMLKGGETWRFDFTGRNRRPPRDPVNALLSLGYSMLAKELAGMCHTVGLDPFLGFLHQPRYGRPALALDLMEEFRPLIADSVAISLLNRGELGLADFVRSANGTFLGEHGRRAFWESWFRRLDTEATHPQFGYKMSYRRMMEVQARQLWRFCRGEAAAYTAFTTR